AGGGAAHRDGGRLGGGLGGGGRAGAAARDGEALADTDEAGVAEAVGGGDALDRGAVALGDARDGVPGADHVGARALGGRAARRGGGAHTGGRRGGAGDGEALADDDERARAEAVGGDDLLDRAAVPLRERRDGVTRCDRVRGGAGGAGGGSGRGLAGGR